MSTEVRYEDSTSIPDYASISIAFEIRTIVDTATLQIGSSIFSVRPAPRVREKSYDNYPGNHPASWGTRFDVDTWRFLAAYDERDQRVGGAVVITTPCSIAAIGGRPGHAVLWDLRVAPATRGRGVGTALLTAAEEVARAAGCRGLDVETQDVNAAACRLYARNGLRLLSIEAGAYHEAPDETKLLWTKEFPRELASVGGGC